MQLKDKHCNDKSKMDAGLKASVIVIAALILKADGGLLKLDAITISPLAARGWQI